MVVLVGLVPVAVLWLFTAPLFLKIGLEEQLVDRASLFVRVMILGLPAVALQETVRKYLQCQGKKISKFLYIVTLYNKDNRALTHESFSQAS